MVGDPQQVPDHAVNDGRVTTATALMGSATYGAGLGTAVAFGAAGAAVGGPVGFTIALIFGFIVGGMAGHAAGSYVTNTFISRWPAVYGR